MRIPVRPLAVALTLAATVGPALSGPSGPMLAQSQDATEPEQMKQVDLSDDLLDNLLAAKKDIDGVLAKLPDSASDQPDAKTIAMLDKAAKGHKFASYGDYEDVSNTVGLVMGGIDPETKTYVGTEALTRKQIAQVQADKSMNPKDRKEALQELNEALKSPVQVKNHANIDVVIKHYDKLAAAMSDEG